MAQGKCTEVGRTEEVPASKEGSVAIRHGKKRQKKNQMMQILSLEIDAAVFL